MPRCGYCYMSLYVSLSVPRDVHAAMRLLQYFAYLTYKPCLSHPTRHHGRTQAVPNCPLVYFTCHTSPQWRVRRCMGPSLWLICCFHEWVLVISCVCGVCTVQCVRDFRLCVRRGLVYVVIPSVRASVRAGLFWTPHTLSIYSQPKAACITYSSQAWSYETCS